jgi:hypothetical protein
MDTQTPAASRPARTRRIIGAAAAGAILLGSGVGIGVALTGGAAAAAGPAAPGARAHKCARLGSGAGRRAHQTFARSTQHAARASRGGCHGPLRLAFASGIHGQITYKARSGFRTLAFERGTVETVSGSAVTVRAADGTTWTWHLVANSVISEGGRRVAAGKLARGEQVLVAGPVVNFADDARLVRIRPAS